MEQMVYLSNRVASSYHVNTTTGYAPYEFTVQLAKPLYLKGGHWQCTLSEFSYSARPKSTRRLLVCSDICNESFVGSITLPVLGLVCVSASIKEPMTETYVSLKRDVLTAITLYIKDGLGDNLAEDIGRVDCTLRFRKQRQA